MINIPEMFGSMVFNEKVMKERLSNDIFSALQKTMNEGKSLDLNVANVVANAMKDWAIELGATHYTHWFQPMTGSTSEKHDSFITPSLNDSVIMEFSGKELVRGEPDASSFPSGGLRATCEARGYTVWDPTSYAFIKDGCLYIPTAFCSYGGEALDKKTPLLRSMQAINKQVLRVLKLFGNDNVTSVKTTVGPEQEYFLIDKNIYQKRLDLIFTGRTLFGAKPPKGQEMDDHYFGIIKPRIHAFMKELDQELWKLGVYAKTEHNEGAPSQHELAPIYATTNLATDHNQITMELMQKIAKKHDMVCLLHEKPFEGVNGSGKHNNWSIITNTGVNLFEPGETPKDNAQFLLFLCAVIKAVDEYQDLLRISVASAGNDHRLGGNEAPPAIVSMFLGDELDAILKSIVNETTLDNKEKVQLKVGVHVLPKFPKDTTDRNRTSPFAFTGNKFEFRMLGSAESVACCNIMLNTAVADELKLFADKLENSKDFEGDLHQLIKETIKEHSKIIFNGNGYDQAWLEEAKNRGLLNLKTLPDALPYYLEKKNVDLFERHNVLSYAEIKARYEIIVENYAKVITIEALTMIDIADKQILPAVMKYLNEVSKTIINKKRASKKVSLSYEKQTLTVLSSMLDQASSASNDLKALIAVSKEITDTTKRALYIKDYVLPKMDELRQYADKMEVKTSKEFWPFPTYSDILYSI